MPERTRLVGAVLVRQGRILLGRRSPGKRSCPGMWDVIGGYVEVWESYEQGLRRELQEELRISPTDLRMVGHQQLSRGSDIRIYRIDAWQGGEPRLSNYEHVALAWFTVAEACALPDLASQEFIPVFRTL